MPNRINPIAQYLVSLAITVFAYAMYAQYAVPAIEGPPNLLKRRESTPIVRPQSSQERKSEFAWLFPKDAWEIETSNTLQTSNGKILFRDYKTLPDGQLVVFPFTMIMDSKKEPGNTADPPMVLRCMKEARIKFDRPFTFGAKSKKGQGSRKMEHAQLTGEVVIYRPPTPNKEDAIEIITRNVQIKKESVSTLEEVDFQLGRHHGKGRNLLIQLAHATNDDTRGASDFSTIEGIRKIELAFLTQLRLEPATETNPLASDSKPTSVLSSSRSAIDIKSGGPFTFDLATKTAVIRKEVRVRQDDKFGDELLCDDLTLVFTGEQADTINPMKNQNSSMKLTKITAVGNPAVINAHSRDSKIRGQKLIYDLKTNHVNAINESGSVTVSNKDFQFDARSFDYVIPPDRSMGPLKAQGPGRMLRMATKKDEEFRASWKDQLTIQDDKDGTKLIQMDGLARVSLNEATNIDADHLKFWMWPTQKSLVNDSQPGAKTQTSFQPAKLLATGNVNIASQKISGKTEQLNATWPKPIQGVSNLQDLTPEVQATRRNSKRPVYQDNATITYATPRTEMIAPANRRAQIALAAFDEPVRSEKKFFFTGKRVTVQLSNQESGSEIQQLDIDGNVTIKEIPVGNANGQPLVISGDRLQMTPQGKDLYRIGVAGSTTKQALVVAQTLRMSGVNIHLDQSANKLWVDGAGKMNMESATPIQNQQPAKGLASQIDVSWGGGMVFDGRTIYFEQDIMMTASQGLAGGKRRVTKTFSQGLSVRLKKSVNFKSIADENNAKRGDTEIDEIVLVDEINGPQRIFQLVKTNNRKNPEPIIVQNQVFDQANNLIEKQKIIVPKATVNADSGAINAAGPGTIMNHRLGKSQLSFSKQTNQPNTNPNAISFMQVNFDGSLKANSERNEMTINGNVRTLYSPVRDWNQTLNPDQTGKLPAGAVKLTCENVDLMEWQPRGGNKATKEVIATGNAHIYGDLFEATSDRVSYNESTDILVIEGTPRSDANLWYQQNARADRDHLVAGKILYRISDQWTQVQKIKKGSFTPSGNPFNR